METLRLLSDIFNVSVDYLVCKTNERTNSTNGTKPQDNFQRAEFQNLTQEEFDALAEMAITLKERRKKKETLYELRDKLKNLTQEEIDELVMMTKTAKEQREKEENN